ncbi:MAG TPA: hypothetical protein VFU79_08265 [Nitrososphaeraceae archaeon]|nr:hypothetical protein [Nitrososphaeraceae archaeon]
MTVGLSWDKAKGKNAKSIERKEIGKIKEISQDYIQIKKGIIDADYFFVPKYFVEGYEDDDIIISLTEAEIKDNFFNKTNPSKDMLDDDNYKKRKELLKNKYPNFESMIPQSSAIESQNDQPSISKGEGVKLSWDKVMGNEIKSSDKKEIGKIKSVGQHFVEVEDGVISKKHYFIPKKYIHGYDGDTIYSSLEKEEIKQKYQRDSPPLDSELREFEKGEDYELIPFMAKEPGLEIKTQRMDEELKIPWEEIIHKHVRTTDNIDIGDVDKVGNEFIVVREGVAEIHLYYIPKKHIIKYDGSSLWLNLSSTLASSKFERKNEPSPEEMEKLLNE